MVCTAGVNTLTAQDTAVGVVGKAGMPLVYFHLLEVFFQVLGLEADPQEFGQFLQLASLVGRTMGAVNIMGGEEESQGRTL